LGIEKSEKQALTVSANGEIVERKREIIEVPDELQELMLDRPAAVAGMPYQQVLTSRLSAAEQRHYAVGDTNLAGSITVYSISRTPPDDRHHCRDHDASV
jgi:hypothetical protein